jgi:hypothetical protein
MKATKHSILVRFALVGMATVAAVSGAAAAPPATPPAGGVPQLEEQILQDVQNLQTTVNNQANSLAVLQQLSGHCTDAATKTRLLFTFVTAQAGFDTALAISNTTADPFGTTPSAGTCTLNFFGFNAPPNPVTTSNIAAGTTNTNLASVIAPGFQGYVIATCNFPFAHGFTFISDVGARNLATGYLATNICSPRVAPQ